MRCHADFDTLGFDLCASCAQAMDLSEAEYQAFGSGIAALAAQRERKPRDFEAFQAFLERNGPYGCIIDGANAALFGQNFEEGGFSFDQIKAVIAQLQEERPHLRPLVVRSGGQFTCLLHPHCPDWTNDHLQQEHSKCEKALSGILGSAGGHYSYSTLHISLSSYVP